MRRCLHTLDQLGYVGTDDHGRYTLRSKIRTPIRRDQLRRVVADAATNGFALVDEELEIGLQSLPVPVKGHGGNVVAALNVSTHASRASVDELRKRCLPALLHAAQELAMVLPR